MQRTSLMLPVALMVMLLLLAGLAEAPDRFITNAQAQYATYGQYGSGDQYGTGYQYGTAQQQYPAEGSGQSDAIPSCQQHALNLLSKPNLSGNSAASNLGLLQQYIKCGGTIGSLPQSVFNTLMMQGVITINVVDNTTNACPKGDPTNCSPVSLGWTH